jgi:hypothetical protein
LLFTEFDLSDRSQCGFRRFDGSHFSQLAVTTMTQEKYFLADDARKSIFAGPTNSTGRRQRQKRFSRHCYQKIYVLSPFTVSCQLI